LSGGQPDGGEYDAERCEQHDPHGILPDAASGQVSPGQW